MPSANVVYPLPLVRLNPWFPGQFGVRGTANETGLRTHPTGAVFYVDPNYPGVSDLRDGTDPDAPLATIAAALTKCQNFRGDTIVVMHNDAWVYGPRTTDYNVAIVENVVVNVHGVRIVGVAPSSSLGPLWRPATSGGVACTVNALDVLIEGFCFSGAVAGAGVGGTAILSQWVSAVTGPWGENLTVRHCFFDDTVDVGIQFVYSWNCHIHDNVFQGCDNAGLYSDPAGSPIGYSQIYNNRFMDVGLGGLGAMAISEANNCEIWGNSIFNSNAQGGGAATNEGINTSAGAGGNLVFGNWFSCILPAAAPGDWDDLNSSSAGDAYVNNHCINGDATTRPT